MDQSLKVPLPARQMAADRLMGAAVVVALGALATICGFLYFQYGLGYLPCPLCLDQRIPYYITLPLAVIVAVAAFLRAPRPLLSGGLIVIAIVILIGGGIGVYHTGIEWKWWPGPADCSGPLTNFGSAGNLLETIQTTTVVRCDEAAWRLFGISLAGYNVLVSLVLAAIALWGATSRARP